MRGKLIVIEGTDCSGKETQSKLLIEKLRNEGVQIDIYSFPSYETPTGRNNRWTIFRKRLYM